MWVWCVDVCVALVCLCVEAGKRDLPWGEEKDGIMHVLNIITMQNLDGISGGIQVLMRLSNAAAFGTGCTSAHTQAHT